MGVEPTRPGAPIGRGIVCIFAKPPYPGLAKTRLAAGVGPQQASALARAFFDDTWARVARLAWVRPVLASTDDDPAAFGFEDVELWLQGDGDLGERMERVMRRALDAAPWVIALGADCPTMRLRTLQSAATALATHDAVVGPADDGGYYLLGLRRLPPRLLSELPWSAPNTLQSTLERLRLNGLTVAQVEPGFDVDDLGDLRRLWKVLQGEPALAPKSFALLSSLRLPE